MAKPKWRSRNGEAEMAKPKWRSRNGEAEMAKPKWRSRNGEAEMAVRRLREGATFPGIMRGIARRSKSGHISEKKRGERF